MRSKTLTIAVMACTALSSAISFPALAAVTVLDDVFPEEASNATKAAMQDQCDLLAAAHGPNWRGTLDESSIVVDPVPVSGPTEIGSHTIDDAIGDPVGAGTFTPAHTEILGDPYRNGGSVNMFGIKQSVGGHYSASEYDFLGLFETTFAFSYTCDMEEEVYIPLQGYYTPDEDAHGNEEAVQNSCDQFTSHGPTWQHWGEHHGQCDFIATGGDEFVWEDRGSEAGPPVNQSQQDELLAHEDEGEGFFTDETLIIGQVVVCISPSRTGTKLPGEWQPQNGYTGDKCTTEWYNGGAKAGVPNLNEGSHNWVTVPVV